MGYSLNSLQGGSIGTRIGVIRDDTGSLAMAEMVVDIQVGQSGVLKLL